MHPMRITTTVCSLALASLLAGCDSDRSSAAGAASQIGAIDGQGGGVHQP